MAQQIAAIPKDCAFCRQGVMRYSHSACSCSVKPSRAKPFTRADQPLSVCTGSSGTPSKAPRARMPAKRIISATSSFSGQAPLHAALRVQAPIQASATGEACSPRSSARMPDATSAGSASATPAAKRVIGQACTQAPQAVHNKTSALLAANTWGEVERVRRHGGVVDDGGPDRWAKHGAHAEKARVPSWRRGPCNHRTAIERLCARTYGPWAKAGPPRELPEHLFPCP